MASDRKSQQSRRKSKSNEREDQFYKPVALKENRDDHDPKFEQRVDIMRYQIEIKQQSKDNLKKAFRGRMKGKGNQQEYDEESSGRPLVTDMKNITFDD